MIENIYWLGHATFKIIAEDKIICIDPFQIKKEDQADIILITHEHFDHCSPKDVEKIQKPDTIIVSSRRRHTRSCLVSWARRCV